MRFTQRFATIASLLFGYMCLFMVLMVSFEVVSRKLFNLSLQGTNELSGYLMACMSCVAAAVAVVGRNHIRIDLLHALFPPKIQAVLNALAATSLAALGWILVYASLHVVLDSYDFQSTAATPWATPLIYPQSLWCFSLLLFTVIATAYAFRALALLARGDTAALLSDFQPHATKQEVQSEVNDAHRREALKAQLEQNLLKE